MENEATATGSFGSIPLSYAKGPAQQVKDSEGYHVIRPTVGRIVHYHHPGSADGTYKPEISPAIVRAIDPNDPLRVQIFVFGPKGQHQDWSGYGVGPCQWSWPERV